MSRFRMSIAGTMAIVVLVALAFAAIKNPTTLCASVLFTLTLGLMLAAIVGAIGSRGRARLAWAGFALFGWGYIAFSFGPFPNGNGVTVPPFPTMVLYSYLEARETTKGGVYPDREPHGEQVIFGEQTGEVPRLRPGTVNMMTFVQTYRVELLDLRRIVHTLGAIVFALIGGIVGLVFARGQDRGAER